MSYIVHCNKHKQRVIVLIKGSRFTTGGEVIEGPAIAALHNVEVNEEK